MEELVKVFLDMIQNGFTSDGMVFIAQVFLAACVVKVLYNVVERVSASIMIRITGRAKPGTYLCEQRLGGQVFIAKVLKVGWFRVFLLNCETGGLLDPTTNEYSSGANHYLPLDYDAAGEYRDRTADYFGL